MRNGLYSWLVRRLSLALSCMFPVIGVPVAATFYPARDRGQSTAVGDSGTVCIDERPFVRTRSAI